MEMTKEYMLLVLKDTHKLQSELLAGKGEKDFMLLLNNVQIENIIKKLTSELTVITDYKK